MKEDYEQEKRKKAHIFFSWIPRYYTKKKKKKEAKPLGILIILKLN